jgi:hypothetical protein
MTTPAIPEFYGQWWVMTVMKNGTTGNSMTVELDGNKRSLVYAAAGTGSLSTAGTTNLQIGYYSGGSMMNGYIAEVLIYRNALSIAERTTIRRYLGAKWGIAVR